MSLSTFDRPEPSPSLSVDHRVLLEIRSPGESPRRVPVDADELLIGSGDFCDLRLDDSSVAMAHSTLHRHGEILWIESIDDAGPLEINGESCTRLALRAGDTIRIGRFELSIRIGGASVGTPECVDDLADLSALTADELCDRIIEEQSEVDEFERRRVDGWRALVTTLEGRLADGDLAEGRSAETMAAAVTNLRSLSDLLAERSQQISDRELSILQATSELQTSQEAMSRKLDQLLQQLSESELRASA